MTDLRGRVNRMLDRAVLVHVRIGQRSLPAFQVCGLVGLAVALTVSGVFTVMLRLSFGIMLAVCAAAVTAFLAVAMIAKIISGRENLIYYHHAIAVFAIAWLVVRGRSGQWSYLDVTALGLGLFLAFGRVGCLLVGCCHGRPHGCGARYGHEHAAAGFSESYVGVRVFPVQLLESLATLGIALVSGALLIWGGRPGLAFAWSCAGYGAARFLLEFLRGDTDRRYWLGLSEAQWTSIAVVTAVLARLGPIAAVSAWPAFLCSFLLARRTGRNGLNSSWHILHVAVALRETRRPAREVVVARTPLGIRISRGATWHRNRPLPFYSVSRDATTLSRAEADSLARLISRLEERSVDRCRLIEGGQGVYHLLVCEEPQHDR